MIEQVRAMVEARYGEISSDVTESVEAEELDAYENAYATEETEDYVHEEGTYSEEGAEATGFEREEGLESL